MDQSILVVPRVHIQLPTGSTGGDGHIVLGGDDASQQTGVGGGSGGGKQSYLNVSLI